jgi:hypothetical protein
MDSTLYLHALMASTSGLTSDLTSPVSGGVSLSMSFSVQRLTEHHLSAASIAASGVRSPALVIAMFPRSTLAHRSRGANPVIPTRRPPSPETNRCEPSALEPEEESCASCSRTWHGDLATTRMFPCPSSACPLAGWLRYQGIRLEPPSIRASRYEDWTPNTAYARGVKITGHLKRPICQNGGLITRSLHGHFNQLASDIDARHVSLGYLRSLQRSTYSPATSPPVVCNPGAPRRGMRSPPARLAVRLERFQACALRNDPALHVPPESNEQATGQGHDANAPHALASQGKAGSEPDAEGRVGLIA